MQVVSRVPVNPRPVHVYLVSQRSQVWAHSSMNGVFDVIPVPPPVLANPNLTVVKVSTPAVKAFMVF